MTTRRLLSILVLLIASTLCAFSDAMAQSTVFNIPSADVLPKHQLYVEADFLAHLASYENGGFQTYGPSLVYGLGKHAEVGVNAFYTRTDPSEPLEIQPNFKWKFYENEKRGLAAAAGGIAFIPVTERSSVTTRGMAYAVVSKNIKGSCGPQVTLGSYILIGSFEEDTSKRGLLLGYEQPLSKRWTFLADWSSGNNDYGYMAVGASITLSPKSVLYGGYNIGNQGRGNNFVGLYYAFTF